jgi:hypothetical protein
MKVLHILNDIAETLNGYTNFPYVFRPVKDGSDRYYAPVEILVYEPWRELWPIFQTFETIEYTPLPPQTED